jgi:hypothetical protein
MFFGLMVLEMSTEVDREAPILGCGSEIMDPLVCDSLAYCIPLGGLRRAM